MSRFVGLLLVGTLSLPPPVFAMRPTEAVQSGLEEKIARALRAESGNFPNGRITRTTAFSTTGLEEAQDKIKRAKDILKKPLALPGVLSSENDRAVLAALLDRVSIVPFPGKGIWIQKGVIHIGITPQRKEDKVAHYLLWAAAVYRGMEIIREKGLTAAEKKKQEFGEALLQVYDLLRRTRIDMHTGQETTLYQGRIFLVVGDGLSPDRLASNLAGAAQKLQSEKQTSTSDSRVLRSEQIALASLGLVSEADRARFDAAKAEGASLAKAETREQKVVEPEIDRALLTAVKQEMRQKNISLQETWPVFADRLSGVLNSASEDQRTRLLEGLYNIFGFIRPGA